MNADGSATPPPFQHGALPFIAHYVRAWRLAMGGLVLLVIGAASCAVLVQYAMKLLVDAMTGPRDGALAMQILGIFIGLIAIESALWRVTGWLGCRTTVAMGIAVRLDLFRHLSGHSMRYFGDNLAGSLGHRVTATAGNLGALSNTVVWKIIPPCVDFIGALIIFAMVASGMAVALALAVGVLVLGLIAFGKRGGICTATMPRKPPRPRVT